MGRTTPSSTRLSCRCGAVALEVRGSPIITVECVCNSCRSAGAFLQALPGAPRLLDEKGATLAAMVRKDRFACLSGAEHLREYRLKPESGTRRVVATCCNSAMFGEVVKSHWIDIYGTLWPAGTALKAEIRTMVGDLPKDVHLPDDIPNAKGYSFTLIRKLIGAWIAMRFRTPKITCVQGTLDAPQ